MFHNKMNTGGGLAGGDYIKTTQYLQPLLRLYGYKAKLKDNTNIKVVLAALLFLRAVDPEHPCM